MLPTFEDATRPLGVPICPGPVVRPTPGARGRGSTAHRTVRAGSIHWAHRREPGRGRSRGCAFQVRPGQSSHPTHICVAHGEPPARLRARGADPAAVDPTSRPEEPARRREDG
ncbi:hypothetical protein FAGKG844_200056 [Frankia sp. AgKG'84/4]